MKTQLAFYCLNENNGDLIVPLHYEPNQPFPSNFIHWQPLTDFIVQIAARCGFSTLPKHNPSSEEQVILVLLANTRSLASPKVLNNLVATSSDDPEKKDKRLRYALDKKSACTSLEKIDIDYIRKSCPILTVGIEDIQDLFAERPLSAEALKKRRYLYDLHFDDRIKFWDSSIWHRYIQLNEQFEVNLLAILNKMKSWYATGLYHSYVALENLELQTRAMLNSYICELDDNGHGRVVTPFKFHSESAMERGADILFNDLHIFFAGENKIRWRLLLVDDYANTSLRTHHNRYANAQNIISKRNIIYNVLHQGWDGYNPLNGAEKADPGNTIFTIKDLGSTSFNIRKKARRRLRAKMYDLILLDYLLGSGDSSRTEREYGYDFLQDLQYPRSKKTSKNLKKGPLGRFWVFPISSFPFAFSDKLRQLGMEGQTDHWFLSGGGDPVTTPELFRYNFYNFIKQQLNDFVPTPAAIFELLKRFSSIESGKLWRELVLNALDQITLHRMILENDESQGSVFAQTMLAYTRNNEVHKNMISGVKNFVQNIAEVPYFKIKVALNNLGESKYAKKITTHLCEKSNLFFQSEHGFEDLIKNHKKGSKLEYDGKRLKWLPDNLHFLNEKKIQELRLSNNDLTILPENIAQLKSLTKLDISYNKIQRLPSSLRELKSLEYLDLTGNNALPPELQTKHEGRTAIRALFDNTESWNKNRAKKVVTSFAQKDINGLKELRKILKPMEDDGLITSWDGANIPPGTNWEQDIQYKFMEADFILLLVSTDFLSSDYIYAVELHIAVEREKNNECTIIPIIYRDSNWQANIIEKYQAVPAGGKSIMGEGFHSPDTGWQEVGNLLRARFKDD